MFFQEEGDSRWLAECRELGTASYGDTPEEARERIVEAIELHLNALERYGERERFFAERGIKMLSHEVSRKGGASQREHRIDASDDPRVFSQPYIHEFAGAN